MAATRFGLTAQDVQTKQAEFGANVLPEKPVPSSWYIFLRQLKNPLIFVLVIAGVITLLIGHYPDAVIIGLAVVVNTVLGFFQERRAANALQALKQYVANRVTVIRDGQRQSISAAQLVPGDIVILNQGVRVPADGRLLDANRFLIDEAILTGESIAVNKMRGQAILMGTTVVAGQAVMEVENIGAKTQMGAIALQIQVVNASTPLQKQLKVFSRQLLLVIAVVISLVFAIGLWHKYSLSEIFTASVALAVSSIPEGLIVSLTVVLAIGMQKILRRRGLVRQLSAAETLGGVTVICLDKTGTLTEGKMTVVDWVGDKHELAKQVLLANDQDDPLVIAAYAWGQSVIDQDLTAHQRLDSIPFTSETKFFTSLHRWSTTEHRLFVNGAPEVVLKWCPLSATEQNAIQATIGELTHQGRRVIGLAYKAMPLSQQRIQLTDAQSDLTWVGLLAFSDPVRSSVKVALEEAREAGIAIKVITGDYAPTSQFVLTELGMPVSHDQVVTGDQIQVMTTQELSQLVADVVLFARTTPDQKLKIVQALKAQDEVVAMMGDGVNDAPALHEADIGIAVGEATDVAKESADLVLLDSNFATILAAVEEGRAMFENIRKVVLYLLSDSFAEIVVVLAGIGLGLPLPLTAVQILWINLVSDGLPNLALTIDPKRGGIMREGPRSTHEKLVAPWMISLVGMVSVVAGLMAFISFWVVYRQSHDLDLARAVAFIVLGLNSLVYVFSIRTLMRPWWAQGMFENKWLVLSVLAGLGLQMLPFALPNLRSFFHLPALTWHYWLYAVILSLVMFLVVEGLKVGYHFFIKKTHQNLWGKVESSD